MVFRQAGGVPQLRITRRLTQIFTAGAVNRTRNISVLPR